MFYFTGYKVEIQDHDSDYKCSKNKAAIQINVVVPLQIISLITICFLFIHVICLIPAYKINVDSLKNLRKILQNTWNSISSLFPYPLWKDSLAVQHLRLVPGRCVQNTTWGIQACTRWALHAPRACNLGDLEPAERNCTPLGNGKCLSVSELKISKYIWVY